MLSFLFLGSIFSQSNIFESSYVEKGLESLETNPRSSNDIDLDDLSINTTTIKRGIETINITFDNSSYDGPTHSTWKNYKVNLTFSDSNQINLTLEAVGDYLSVVFTPSITNTTGETKITILAVDDDDVVQNTIIEPHATITIQNNLPKVGVSFNTFEVLRNENLILNYTPSDIEDNVFNLEWEISIRNGTNNLVELLNPRSVMNFSNVFQIPTYYTDRLMFVNATCWDSDGDSSTNIYYFQVVNNLPVFSQFQYSIDGVSVSKGDLLNEGVYRGSQTINITFNTSDVESSGEKLLLSISANDPFSGTDVFQLADDLKDIEQTEENIFSVNITFPSSMAIGVSDLTLELKDPSDGIKTSIIPVNIKNNFPVMESLSINGTTSEQITFLQGEYIEFKFNVFDFEKDISFVQVNIFYQSGENIKNFNYTVAYLNMNSSIIIRAYDLPAGDFFVYATVIDGEGDSAKGDVLSFSISPEGKTDISTWIIFSVGLIIGLAVGGGLFLMKSKSSQGIESVSKGKSNNIKTEKKKEESKSVQTRSDKPEPKKNSKNKNKKVIRKL